MNKVKFSFRNFARLVIKRQEQKKADTFIIIYGLPRTGKTVLGFKILLPYLMLMRKLCREGKSGWKIPMRWAAIFRQYFSTSAGDMIKNIKVNPPRSFNFVDEGLDVMSWLEMLKKEQKMLVELIQKSGSKLQLTILITPSLSLLTKAILARAHYLFIIVDEPKPDGNYAYLLKNYTNPILAENFPFGLKKIIKSVLKTPALGEKYQFENFLVGRDRFIGKIKFANIDKKLYDLYDKLVKTPSIERDSESMRTVPSSKYQKLMYAFDTILFNLKEVDMKPVVKIERLLRDKFGIQTIAKDSVRRRIDRMTMMQIRPRLDDAEPFEDEVESEDHEDIEVDSTLEGMESDIDAVDEADAEEEQVETSQDHVG